MEMGESCQAVGVLVLIDAAQRFSSCGNDKVAG